MLKRSLKDAIESRATKYLVYGGSGVGKTTLIASLPGKILILSAESGLLSLSGADIDADGVLVRRFVACEVLFRLPRADLVFAELAGALDFFLEVGESALGQGDLDHGSGLRIDRGRLDGRWGRRRQGSGRKGHQAATCGR